MIKVMFDTCILIDFLLIEWKDNHKQLLHRGLRKSKEIKDLFLKGELQNIATQWNILEYRDVVEKLVSEKILIENGYSLQEFAEARTLLPIDESQRRIINEAVEAIQNNSFYAKINQDDDFTEVLVDLCMSGFSLLDAIHIIEAVIIPDCEYFITRDNNLIRATKNLLPNENFKKRGLRIVNPKEFLSDYAMKKKGDKLKQNTNLQ